MAGLAELLFRLRHLLFTLLILLSFITLLLLPIRLRKEITRLLEPRRTPLIIAEINQPFLMGMI